MTRNKKTSAKSEGRKSLMFWSLHPEVTEVVSDRIGPIQFLKKHSQAQLQRDKATCIMGRFTCPNTACATNGWSSKKVAIHIRKYYGDGYNALVYNQRCKACNYLGYLTINEQSYIDRVSYRLLVWAGETVSRPTWNENKGRAPHKKDLCEGCKAGKCPDGLLE